MKIDIITWCLGPCPAVRNLSTDFHVVVNALARYTLQKFKIEARKGRLRWAGESAQTEWNSTCQPISMNASKCNVVGRQLCFNYHPNARKAPRLVVCYNQWLFNIESLIYLVPYKIFIYSNLQWYHRKPLLLLPARLPSCNCQKFKENHSLSWIFFILCWMCIHEPAFKEAILTNFEKAIELVSCRAPRK